MTPEDFVKYQVLVAPKPKPEKTREQELADRVNSLKRLRSQDATHKGQIDKLDLDLQRHRDVLQRVLSRIQVESEGCDELRTQVAREQAPSEHCEPIPPTQCDSQQENDMISQTASEEMYLSTVEEESRDESMLMGTSTGAEDDLDVSRDNGIWERCRNAITKIEMMVKLKDKVKVTPFKTIIIEEEPPPAPQASRKPLADVIARLSPVEIGLVIGCKIVFSLLGLNKLWCSLLMHNLLISVGSLSSPVFLKTFKKRSLFHPQRPILPAVTPNRRQREGRDAGAFSPLRPQARSAEKAVLFLFFFLLP